MATKIQKAFAEQYLQDHPEVNAIYLNVNKDEWFTDKSYAENSRAKDKEGKPTDKLEIFNRKVEIIVETDLAEGTGGKDQGTGEPEGKGIDNQDPEGKDQGTGEPEGKGSEPEKK